MFDVDLIFTIIFCLVFCWGFASSYREIRKERAGMPNSTYRQKVLSRLLVTAAILIWFCCLHLYVHYDESRPAIADEPSGRIYSISNHGHIVYVTLAERSGLFLLGLAAAACFISGYFLDRRVANALAGYYGKQTK